MDRRNSARVLVGVLLLALSSLGVPAHAAPAPSNTNSGGVTLTATPTSGYAPLSVEFSVTLPANRTLPTIAWQFGDGASLNGTTASDLDPVHLYVAPGDVVAEVVLTWTTGSVNASIPIHVAAANVTASIGSNVSRGPAPLTVRFTGTGTGGSGTFVAFDWTFGDGGNGTGPQVSYTYASPGRYPVALLVIDSRGDVGRASTWVNVSDPANGSPSGGGGAGANGTPSSHRTTWLGQPPLVWETAAALAALGAGLGALGLLVRRRLDGPSPPPTDGDTLAPRPGLDEPPAPVATRSAPEAAEEPPTPPPSTSPVPSRILRERQIANRVVRHLASQPRLGPADVPGPAWTQAGMAEALGVGQSAVSRVLGELVQGKIVEVRTEHVVGSSRRMRVYRLTARGERLGSALRPPE